jgi:hypothetical protein
MGPIYEPNFNDNGNNALEYTIESLCVMLNLPGFLYEPSRNTLMATLNISKCFRLIGEKNAENQGCIGRCW